MRMFLIIIALLVSAIPANADALARHFFGSDAPRCSVRHEPVVIFADLTVDGEIDDSITLVAFRRLERAGCIDVRALVSIYGNGGSSTATVHENIIVRVRELGLADVWGDKLLRGPDRSMRSGGVHALDDARYRAIAEIINASPRPITIVELGPLTGSATLLREGYIKPSRVKRILGVGGRVPGESFGTGRGLGLFASFSDFNVRKDTAAVDYLVRHHGRKLRMVTYRTGIGDRMVPADVIARDIPALAKHAALRARTLAWLGYPQGYIPSWDTWLSSFFVKGGPESLGCRRTYARMLKEPGARDLRLMLNQPEGQGHAIVACHELRGS